MGAGIEWRCRYRPVAYRARPVLPNLAKVAWRTRTVLEICGRWLERPDLAGWSWAQNGRQHGPSWQHHWTDYRAPGGCGLIQFRCRVNGCATTAGGCTRTAAGG